MDVTRFLEPRIAPRAVFDDLAGRRSRVRFMVPSKEGDGWTSVTWEAYAGLIRELSLFLSASGLRAGDRAIVLSPNSVAWGAAALAIQATGGVLVPVYPASTPEQAGYVAEHSEARFVFVDCATGLRRVLSAWTAYAGALAVVTVDDALDVAAVHRELAESGAEVPAFADVDRKVITWSRALAVGAARHREDPSAFERTMAAVSLDQPGLMLYTSGTTGNPKGVPLTHRNVAVNGADWLRCNAPLLEESAVDLLWLPMSHIFGLGELCLGNSLGWTTYLSDPQRVLAKLPEVRPSVFMSVPSHWEKIAASASGASTPAEAARRLQAATGGNLRFCLSGGAGLKREVKELFHASGVLLIEGYGLTECSPTLTLNRPDAFRFDSVGKPLPSVELKLAEDGEILARGPNVFSGYFKDAAATREAFTDDGWFKTGDVGRLTDEGFLQIVDRKKDILVTAGGKNVPPANIELCFRDDPLVAHVVVYGDGKRYLVAGVWLNDEAVRAHLADVKPGARQEVLRALVQTRIDRVNRGLASYETVKRFSIMDLPLTVEGGFLTQSFKVRRKKVYEAFREAFESLYAEESSAASAAKAQV